MTNTLTPAQVLAVKAPDGLPFRQRVDLAWMHGLARLNRLEGFLPAIAIWWALWTLLAPSWAIYWPSHNPAWRAALPVMSWVLLLGGASRVLGGRLRWRLVTRVATIAMLGAWSTLTYSLATVEPIASAGVAIYSALAMAELVAWASLGAGIDRSPAPGSGRE